MHSADLWPHCDLKSSCTHYIYMKKNCIWEKKYKQLCLVISCFHDRTSIERYLCQVTNVRLFSKRHTRARNRFYQEVEAKRFKGVFLCRKVC